MRKKSNQFWTNKSYPWIVIFLFFLSCSTPISQVFQDNPPPEVSSTPEEVTPEIAERFTVETNNKEMVKKTKKKAKKEVQKKIKKEAVDPLPKDLQKIYNPIDLNSQELWKSYTPYATNEEEMLMKVSFFGVTVGYMKISIGAMVHIKDNKAYHFSARLKSADFYSFIYTLDNLVEGYVDSETMLPMKFNLTQRETKQKVDELQLYDTHKRKVYSWYKREKIKNGEISKKNQTGYLPKYFQDSMSVLFFTRGLPLEEGHIYEFPIINRAKPLILKMKVFGIEDVRVNKKFYKAYKMEATSWPLEGEKKDGYILFWYSTDPDRRMLKFSANVKFGDVSGELMEYKRGPPLNLND